MLNAELASQQRYAAEENESLKRQVGVLQMQLDARSASDTDAAVLMEKLTAAEPTQAELAVLREDNASMRLNLDAATEKVRA